MADTNYQKAASSQLSVCHERYGENMIPRIKSLKAIPNYKLQIVFDDGKAVIYDVKEDMDNIESYRDLMNIHGLFNQVQVDPSRTCVYWNDYIDLPSDALYEYGKPIICEIS